MTFKIQNTSQLSRNGTIKNVIYGPAKIGKTSLAATVGDVIVISTESGLLSLRRFNIPYIEVDDTATLREAGEWLYKSTEARRYRNVIFDSTSDIAEVVNAEKKRKFNDGRKSTGELNDEIMLFWRTFREVPDKNIIFIAKEQWEQNGPYNFVRPMLPSRNLVNQLPYMFDGTFRMGFVAGTDGGQYRGIQCQADAYTMVGDRSGTLAMWEPPDLSHLINKQLRG